MKLRIEHALIVTHERSRPGDRGRGPWWSTATRLEYVGPARRLAPRSGRRPGHRREAASLRFPGLMDAHNHSPANIFRGLMPARPLEIWARILARRTEGRAATKCST